LEVVVPLGGTREFLSGGDPLGRCTEERGRAVRVGLPQALRRGGASPVGSEVPLDGSGSRAGSAASALGRVAPSRNHETSLSMSQARCCVLQCPGSWADCRTRWMDQLRFGTS